MATAFQGNIAMTVNTNRCFGGSMEMNKLIAEQKLKIVFNIINRAVVGKTHYKKKNTVRFVGNAESNRTNSNIHFHLSVGVPLRYFKKFIKTKHIWLSKITKVFPGFDIEWKLMEDEYGWLNCYSAKQKHYHFENRTVAY